MRALHVHWQADTPLRSSSICRLLPRASVESTVLSFLHASISPAITLDIVHVLEYLWRAAYAFHHDGTPEAEAWVEHQLAGAARGPQRRRDLEWVQLFRVALDGSNLRSSPCDPPAAHAGGCDESCARPAALDQSPGTSYTEING
jgi:hypothetical protein